MSLHTALLTLHAALLPSPFSIPLFDSSEGCIQLLRLDLLLCCCCCCHFCVLLLSMLAVLKVDLIKQPLLCGHVPLHQLGIPLMVLLQQCSLSCCCVSTSFKALFQMSLTLFSLREQLNRSKWYLFKSATTILQISDCLPVQYSYALYCMPWDTILTFCS